MIETPLADKVIAGFGFKDEAGRLINFCQGQREIMDCILARSGPDGKRRVQVITPTRFGKSESAGAAVAVRVSTKPEKWAVVAGTQDKARIIMDYTIRHVLDSPLLRTQLDIGEDSLDRLRRERSRDRLTFKNRGELRVFSADSRNRQQLGNSLMGFGAPNVIEDESALIDDDIHSKVMRMLGDDAENNFIMKIGNPFTRGHFLRSWESERYYKIFIDWHRALEEGRLTQDFVDEMREEANFDVFYECKFPAADMIDSKGWIPLLTDEQIERALVDTDYHFGERRLGIDVAGGGRNFSVGTFRSTGYAEKVFKENISDTMLLVPLVIEWHKTLEVPGENVAVDKVGIGRGCSELLTSQIGARGINAGDPPEDADQFTNLRAEIFWRVRQWILGGGKLKRDDDWFQLTKLKYRTTLEGKRGKIQVISKEELLRQGVESLDVADALAFTFARREMFVPGTSTKAVVEPQREAFDPHNPFPDLLP